MRRIAAGFVRISQGARLVLLLGVAIGLMASARALDLEPGRQIEFTDQFNTASVVDPATNLAYTSLWTSPARIWRYRLTPNFVRDVSLTLEQADGRPLCAVIDSAAGFAYFGTDARPGRIVKINLATFTRVGALTLQPGEDRLHAATIDPAGGFALFGTDTAPGRVVKLDLASFTRVGALTLPAGLDALRGGGIHAGASVFVTRTAPGHLVRVRHADLSLDASVPLGANSDLPSCVGVDAPAGRAYAGTDTPEGRILTVDLASTPSVVSNRSATYGYLTTVSVDSAGQAVYFGCGREGRQIVRYHHPTNLILRRATNSVDGNIASSFLDPSGAYVYFPYRESSSAPFQARVLRVSTAAFNGAVSSLVLTQVIEPTISCGVIDAEGRYLYLGVDGDAGVIHKVDLQTMQPVGRIDLPAGESNLTCAAIDPAGAFAYFGTRSMPCVVIKVDLATFERVGSIVVSNGGPVPTWAVFAEIDPEGEYAYFGMRLVGGVTKINLATFTLDSVLNTNPLMRGLLGPHGDVLYAGTLHGRLLEIPLASFSVARNIEVSGYTGRAIWMHPEGNAIFMPGPSYARRIWLDSFEVDNRLLNPGGVAGLESAVGAAGPPNSGVLIFAGQTPQACIYNLDTLALRRQIPLPQLGNVPQHLFHAKATGMFYASSFGPFPRLLELTPRGAAAEAHWLRYAAE